jgi:hypothetical protein
MNAIDIEDITKRAYVHVREDIATVAFLTGHPRELARLPRWLREKRAATMALRSPWWPYAAVEWVAAALPPRPHVFEYGGGGSTLWLEDLGATVTVVEHDETWHGQISAALSPGTTVLFRPAAAAGTITSSVASGFFDDYIAAVDSQPDDSLDLVIVDGRARVECVRRAMPKLREGGILVLDDAGRSRYQPAVQALTGWERHAFAGLKPGQRHPADTSAWKRLA